MGELIKNKAKSTVIGKENEKCKQERNHMEQKVEISLNSESLDNAVEKANRLVELLREVQQIVDSLSGADIDYVRELVTKKCKLTF